MTATIGILLCDHFPPSTQTVAGGDIDELYRRLLGRTDDDLVFRTYDARAGELPASTGECDAWIVTGSRASAYDPDEWIDALKRWIRAATARRERIAGVCFGHQVIAAALGGTVEPAGFWKAGPHALHLDATDWFAAATVHINAMHRDVVTALPPGAEPAGSGETGAIPAFSIGDHVLCLQDHPEFTHAVTELLVDARPELLGPEVSADARTRLGEHANDGPAVGRMLVDFLLDRRR